MSPDEIRALAEEYATKHAPKSANIPAVEAIIHEAVVKAFEAGYAARS